MAQSKPAPLPRKERKPRKLDREKVLALHGQGLKLADIAQHQAVAESTVWRFLQATAPERRALEEFKRTRGDVFARIQGLSLDLQERILRSIDDGILAASTVSQKSGLLHVLNAQTGTAFDKERLETGKSTQNIGLVAKMMGDAFDSALKEPSTIDAASELGDHEGT